MPPHKEHAWDSLTRYRRRFDSLHTWMDEPWEILGTKHRMYRHNPETTPLEAKKLFGEYADHACLDHILLDWRHSPWRFESNSITYLKRRSTGTRPRSSATSVEPMSQPAGESKRGFAIFSADEKRSLQEAVENLRWITPAPKEIVVVPKTPANSPGTLFADLFRTFLLLTTFKYFLPG